MTTKEVICENGGILVVTRDEKTAPPILHEFKRGTVFLLWPKPIVRMKICTYFKPSMTKTHHVRDWNRIPWLCTVQDCWSGQKLQNKNIEVRRHYFVTRKTEKISQLRSLTSLPSCSSTHPPEKEWPWRSWMCSRSRRANGGSLWRGLRWVYLSPVTPMTPCDTLWHLVTPVTPAIPCDTLWHLWHLLQPVTPVTPVWHPI